MFVCVYTNSYTHIFVYSSGILQSLIVLYSVPGTAGSIPSDKKLTGNRKKGLDSVEKMRYMPAHNRKVLQRAL